jgi:enoyl-CoA hydratase/carnithine racemase
MSASHQFVGVERQGHLTLIRIDRPQVLNALHPPAHHELAAVFDDFAADPEQWVAIITGSGARAFCAGNDLKVRAAEGRQGLPASGFGGLTARVDLDKPVIAAVNGLALGGGFELALACDLIVADQKAQFGLPEVKVGLAALAGGLVRLPRQIGLKAAMGIALTGRELSSAEALALGCINEVTTSGAAVEGARRWAEQILRAAPLAVRATKQVMLNGLRHTELVGAIAAQEQFPAVQALRASEDAIEGVRAFVEKRTPTWQAR